jgi:hypothetical protein
VLIAVTTTAAGFAFDAGGGKELTNVFATLYDVGCVAAVLMVRQSAIFTAIVQPPMILFAAVPGAYFMFHGGSINGLKDILINCAYPLVERFPLMVFTAGTVLLIGLARWFLGGRHTETEPAAAEQPTSSRLSAVKEKIAGFFSAPGGDEEDGAAPTRRHSARSSKSARASRKSASERAESPRPRRSRPPRTDDDLPEDRPARRSRSARPREDDELLDRPRRRSTTSTSRTTRSSYDPLRSPYDRREPRERTAPADRSGRHDSYDPVEAYEPPPRRRPATNGASVTNSSHHPISRVRYRGSPAETGSRQERSRSRPWEAESWEYDI